MRQEFTYNQIAHLNAALHEQRLPYRISFHDAETAVVEPLGFCACDGKEGMLKAAIEAFFEKEGMTVTFSDHCEIISPGCRTGFCGSLPVETGETGKMGRLEGRSRNSKIFEMGTDF